MSKTYRLPEIPAGEYEGEMSWSGCAGATPEYRVHVPGLGWVTVASSEITEVVTLPEEPPVGAVIRKGGTVLERLPDVSDGEECWHAMGEEGSRTWKWVRDDFPGDIVHLVPEPVVEPVTLPWTERGVDKHGSREALVEMSHSVFGRVYVDALSQHLAPDTADAMAAALTTAAAKARQS